MPHGVCVLGCCHTGVSSLGKGTSLKIHTFGIATVAALLISQLSAPLPLHEVYARDNLDPSWRQIMRSGSENFGCFTRYLGDLCDVNNLEQRSAL